MREYDYIPRPKIEEHYHIRELFEQQDRRVEDRQYHRDRIKNLEERQDQIKEAKTFIFSDFYCRTCKTDFKSQAVKQVEEDWSDSSQQVAFYKTKCFKGHWCIRLITDRHKDAFWSKSRFVNLDRGNHANDVIQPYETGFNLLYGKKNATT